MHFVLLDFCAHIDIYHFYSFYLSYVFYCQTYIYIRMIWFVNISDSFIAVIILKTLKVKSSVSSATHISLDNFLRVL